MLDQSHTLYCLFVYFNLMISLSHILFTREMYANLVIYSFSLEYIMFYGLMVKQLITQQK